MKLQELFTEDRAVSPVIGVILMVAITVILAAVIGAFVLGIGGETDATPSASISLDTDDQSVTIEHNGGDTLDLDEFRMTVNGTTVDKDDDEALSALDGVDDTSATFRSGETRTVNLDGTDMNAETLGTGATVTLVHDPSGGTIARTTV